MSRKKSSQGVRRRVAGLTREDLEDAYLQLYDKELQGRQKLQIANEDMRTLKTQLARSNQLLQKALGGTGMKVDSAITLQQKLEDLEAKYVKLKAEKESADRSNLLLQQQMKDIDAKTRRGSRYAHVESRVKGMRRESQPSFTERRSSTATPDLQAVQKRQKQAILELQQENSKLEDQVQALELRIEEEDGRYKQLEIESSNEIKLLEQEIIERENECQQLMDQLDEEKSYRQGHGVEGNKKILKLTRQMKQVQDQLMISQARIEELEHTIQIQENEKSDLEQQIKLMKNATEKHQSRQKELEEQWQSNLDTSYAPNAQAEIEIEHLRKENKLLKEARDKLVDAALDQRMKQQHEKETKELLSQIDELEKELDSVKSQESDLKVQIASQAEETSKQAATVRDLRLQLYQVTESKELLEKQLAFYQGHSDIDAKELQEAVAFLREKKAVSDEEERLSFLPSLPDRQQEKNNEQSQLVIKDMTLKLEQTQQLLKVESEISQELRSKVTMLEQELDRAKHGRDAEMEKLSQIADDRLAKIQRLESNLRDIAYGTNQKQLFQPSNAAWSHANHDLPSGSNKVILNLSSVDISQSGADILGTDQPSFLLTWQFYNGQLEGSNLKVGLNPRFDASQEMEVQMSDQFINYMLKDHFLVDLYQVVAGEAKEFAWAKVQLQQVLLDERAAQGSEVHLKVDLIHAVNQDVIVGKLLMTMKFAVPMQLSVEQYRKRAQASEVMKQNGLDQFEHYINISILKCENLDVDIDTAEIFVAFAFGSEKVVTPIVKGSKNPNFDFQQTFQLAGRIEELKSSFKEQLLSFMVVNQIQSQILGIADVPLSNLVDGLPIQGAFALKSESSDTVNQKVYVQIRWQDELEHEAQRRFDSSRQHHADLVQSQPTVSKGREKSGHVFQRLEISKPEASSLHDRNEDRERDDAENGHDHHVDEQDDNEYELVASDARSEFTTASVTSQIDAFKEKGPKRKTAVGAPPITIIIHRLAIFDDQLLQNQNVQHLYICYQFLHVDRSLLETPVSLPKPEPGKAIKWDFERTFEFSGQDGSNSVDNAIIQGADLPRNLKRLAKKMKKEGATIVFDVVSEPAEDDQDAECFTVGRAWVDLAHVLRQGEDIISEPLDVLSVDNQRNIGMLWVTVLIVDALSYLLKKKSKQDED